MDAITETALQLLARRLDIHHRLGASDRQAILDLPHKIRRLEAQAYTVREGDRPEQCALLLQGYSVRHKVTGEGSRQILAINIPGDAIDLQNLFLEESDHNVQMLTRGAVAEIPMRALQELALTHGEIGRAILVMALAEASIFREWAVNIGRRDARSRISHLLCEFAYRLKAEGLSYNGVYELPMTQEQLADATGLTSVHVNRTLQELRRDGLIELERKQLHILDMPRIMDVAMFNPNYLHLDHEGRHLDANA